MFTNFFLSSSSRDNMSQGTSKVAALALSHLKVELMPSTTPDYIRSFRDWQHNGATRYKQEGLPLPVWSTRHMYPRPCCPLEANRCPASEKKKTDPINNVFQKGCFPENDNRGNCNLLFVGTRLRKHHLGGICDQRSHPNVYTSTCFLDFPFIWILLTSEKIDRSVFFFSHPLAGVPAIIGGRQVHYLDTLVPHHDKPFVDDVLPCCHGYPKQESLRVSFVEVSDFRATF